MRSVSLSWAGVSSVAVAILVFFAVNLVGHQVLSKYRIDLTEHRLYSLSEGTERLLARLDEPIVLKFFVSRSEFSKMPGFNAYIGRIERLLHEYARLSNGMVTVVTIEPEAFSESEDTAVGHGLTRVPDGQGNSAYLGLVGSNSIDDTRTISFFVPEREELLEYDLTRLIYQLNGRERKVVGVISNLPVQGTGGGFAPGAMPPQPWSFLVRLESFFDLRMLSPAGQSLPEDLDMLVVIHPGGFSERLVYEIDQFAIGGKSVLIFVDPFSETLAAMPQGSVPVPDVSTGADLNAITQNWGVTLRSGKIVGDLPIAARVVQGQDATGKAIPYPVWMNVQPDQFNVRDPITSQLGNVIMATAGVLEIKPESGLEIETLIETSASAKLYDYETFSTVTNVRQLLEDYQEGGERMVMGVRISGTAASAFPQGYMETDNTRGDKDVTASHKAKGVINAVVVSDTDLLHDRFWIERRQMFNQTIAIATVSNGDLVHNAVENLAGDSSLIGIRSRGGYFRPFKKFQHIQRVAEQQYLVHETRLLEELERIETVLVDFQSGKERGDGTRILTDVQRDELENIRSTQLDIRQQLRDVRHRLGKEINQLETTITVINMFATPLLVTMIAVYMGIFGWRRRGRGVLRQVREISK